MHMSSNVWRAERGGARGILGLLPLRKTGPARRSTFRHTAGRAGCVAARAGREEKEGGRAPWRSRSAFQSENAKVGMQKGMHFCSAKAKKVSEPDLKKGGFF